MTDSDQNNKSQLKDLTELRKKSEENLHTIADALLQISVRIEEDHHLLERIAQALERSVAQRQELSSALKELQEGFCCFVDSMCYGIEDRAMKSLPIILKNKHDILVKSPLVRKFIKYSGKEFEVNIYGTGTMKEKEIFIVGEARPKLSKELIDDFLKVVTYIEKYNRTAEERFVFIITCSVCPEVEEYAKKKDVEIIWSYEV